MSDGNIYFGVLIKILGLCSVTQKGRASCEHRTQDTSASVPVKDHRRLLAKQPSVPKKSGESCQRSAHTLLPEQPQLTPVLWLTSLQHSKGSAVPTSSLSFLPATAEGQKLWRGNLTIFSDFLCVGVKKL